MNLHLNLRSRVETSSGSGLWKEVAQMRQFPARETAILICDMWDRHWCRSATRRCDAIAHQMAPVIEAARARGVQIIHSPSDCMEFYKETPQRRRMIDAPHVDPPAPRQIDEPPLPIDDSDGGCDDTPPDEPHTAWTREHPALRIAEEDGISDSGAEVYNFLRSACSKFGRMPPCRQRRWRCLRCGRAPDRGGPSRCGGRRHACRGQAVRGNPCAEPAGRRASAGPRRRAGRRCW